MQKLPRPTRDQLIAWRKSGKTLQMIATERDVSLSLVKLWVAQLDGQTYGRRRPRPEPAPLVPPVPDPEVGMTRMERAKFRLGKRLCERRGNYFIDDKFVTTQQLLDAAGV